MVRKETFEIMRKGCPRYSGGKCVGWDVNYGNSKSCAYENCRHCMEDSNNDCPLDTPDEFADKLLNIYKVCCTDSGAEEDVDDALDAHIEMKDAICELLFSLGYDEAAWIFWSTPELYE